MKKFITLLMLANMFMFAGAQTIKINGLLIETKDDFHEEENEVAVVQRSASLGVQYVIIQFFSLPEKEEREYLESHGITLIEYLQSNAYYASLSCASAIDLPKRKSQNIKTVTQIKPDYKISEEIASGVIPSYARQGIDQVKVVIQFFSVDDLNQIEEFLDFIDAEDILISNYFKDITTTVKISDISDIAQLTNVVNISLAPPLAKPLNTNSSAISGATALKSKVLDTGYCLLGKGVRVGLWDLDVEFHLDFIGRLTIREDEYRLNNSHGMHTGGTIAGAGNINSFAIGMAPMAQLYTWNFNYQSNRLRVEQEMEKCILEDSIDISSHSYGYALSSCPSWFGYSSTSRNNDKLAVDFPTHSIVFAAGNEQSDCPDGFRTLTNTRKNILMVASSDYLGDMTSYSGFGPTNDGRLMPNITADGRYMYSCAFYNGYSYSSGTSMACPSVSGTIALLYERYKNLYGGQAPLSALIRSIVCNTAIDGGNDGPDFKFGYGIINAVRALRLIENRQYYNSTVSQGDRVQFDIEVPEGVTELKVMIAWNDTEGPTYTDKALVNDLDLKVTHDGETYLPWVLDPDQPSALPSRKRDDLNNIEQVTIDNPEPGYYEFSIEGYAVASVSQDFSLSYEVVEPEIKFIHPTGSEIFSPKEDVAVHWIYNGESSTFALEYSTDGGNHYTLIKDGIPANDRSYGWQLPDTITGSLMLRLSTFSSYCETDHNIQVMSKVENVSVTGDSPSYFLQWDAIVNAKYLVQKVSDDGYITIAEVDNNSYQITDPSYDEYDWYAVTAVDLSTGAFGTRSDAKQLIAYPVSQTSTPYFNDFNSQLPNDVFLTKKGTQGSYSYVNDEFEYGYILDGVGDHSGWVTVDRPEDNFDVNAGCLSSLVLDHVRLDPTEVNHLLSFFYRQNMTDEHTSAFRVKVNDSVIPDYCGQLVHSEQVQLYQRLVYDLSSFADEDEIKIEIEAVNKSAYDHGESSDDEQYYDELIKDIGDFVAIDNLCIASDEDTVIRIDSIFVTEHFDGGDTVTVHIVNGSAYCLTGFPMCLHSGDVLLASEILTDTVYPLADLYYQYYTELDLIGSEQFLITATIDLPNNLDSAKDHQCKIINHDSCLVLMGQIDTITTAESHFIDDGGSYEDYSNSMDSWLTFVPDSGKNCKVQFSSFWLEEQADRMEIFIGSGEAKELVGTYTGVESPPTIVSETVSGELSFHFVSDGEYHVDGWEAIVNQVDKPTVDVSLDSIILPYDVVTCSLQVEVSIQHKGTVDLDFVPLVMSDNGGVVVKDTLWGLSAGERVVFTFDSLVHFQILGDHQISITADVAGDAIQSNNTISDQIHFEDAHPDLVLVEVHTLPQLNGEYPLRLVVENVGNELVNTFGVSCACGDSTIFTETYQQIIYPGDQATITTSHTICVVGVDSGYLLSVDLIYAEDEDSTSNYVELSGDVYNESTINKCGHYTALHGDVSDEHLCSPYNINTNFTIEFWIALDIGESESYIFEKGSIALRAVVKDEITSSLILDLETLSGDISLPMVDMDVEHWHHVAIVCGVDNSYTLYLDGVMYSLSQGGILDNLRDNSDDILVIGNNRVYAKPINGYIDEFRIWDSALSATTLVQNQYTDYPPYTPGLFAYYKFNASDDRFLIDYSSLMNTYDLVHYDTDPFYTEPQLMCSFSVDSSLYITATKQGDVLNILINNQDQLDSLICFFSSEMGSSVYINDSLQYSGQTANDFASGQLVFKVRGTGFTETNEQYLDVIINVASQEDECKLFAIDFNTTDNPDLTETLRLVSPGHTFYGKVSPEIDLSTLVGRFSISTGATIIIDGEDVTDKSISLDFCEPIIARVISESGICTQIYGIHVDGDYPETSIESFSIPGIQAGKSHIDSDNKNVMIWLMNDTAPGWFSPLFTMADYGVLYDEIIPQVSGVTAHDFSEPVVYTARSEDGTSEDQWTVVVATDNEKPTITLLGSEVMNYFSPNIFDDPGVKAYDNADGDISSLVISEIEYYSYDSLDFMIHYSVTDAAGNESDLVTRRVLHDSIATGDLQYYEGINIQCVEGHIVVYSDDMTLPTSIDVFSTSGNLLYKETMHGVENTINMIFNDGCYVVRAVNDRTSLVKVVVIDGSR